MGTDILGISETFGKVVRNILTSYLVEKGLKSCITAEKGAERELLLS